MNKKSAIISIITLAVLGLLSWLLISAAVSWIKTLDSSVTAALTTAALGLLGLWYAQWHSKSRDIAESHRGSKIEVYSIFLDIVEKFQEGKFAEDELGENKLPEWLRKDFIRLNRGLLLWASPNVITAWLKFRTASTSGGNVLLAMDQMYGAIRKDLGNSNFTLKTGDLIRIGLKDPNEFKT